MLNWTLRYIIRTTRIVVELSYLTLESGYPYTKSRGTILLSRRTRKSRQLYSGEFVVDTKTI